MKRKRKESRSVASFRPTKEEISGKPIVRTGKDFGPDAWAGTADGDCMSPIVEDGSIIVFSPSAPLANGCIACIETTEGQRSVKRIYDAGCYFIARPDNAAYAPFLLHKSKVRFMTRAVWCVPVIDGQPDEEAGYCLEAPPIHGGVVPINLMPVFNEPPRISAGGAL